MPEKPEDPVALLDACIVFFPQHFEQCPSLAEATVVLEDVTCLDFDLGAKAIPAIWHKLRDEARPFFKLLHIREAVFQPVVMLDERSF